MAVEAGGGIFFQLPFRNAADGARPAEEFVAQRPGGSAVAGIVDHEAFVAMGRNHGLIAEKLYGLDAVKYAASGRPEFHLADQAEQVHPGAVKALGLALLGAAHHATFRVAE